MITGRQIAAARALLDWTQSTLAEKAEISLNSVKLFERSKGHITPVIISAMRRALEDNGIEFTDTEESSGVARRKDS